MQQMSLDLIHRKLNEVTVDQRQEDGYFNATAMCKAAGKQFAHYLENDATKKFLKVLAAKLGIPIDKGNPTLIEVRAGSPATGGGSWIHPKVAINLAQWASVDFAVLVTDWVEDYWRIKSQGAAAASSLPDYFNRYLINKPKIPTGYFSILQMTTMELAGPLQQLGYNAPAGMTMDISVGLHYCKHLRDDLGIDPETFENYWHEWGSSRPPVQARLYPNHLLEDFYSWFASKYLAHHAKSYFGRKDKAALTYLDKMPALAAPPKPPALKPPASF